MVMARITLPTLPRVSAISAMASRIGGIDISPSITRITMPSAHRTKPETRPMARPTADAMRRDRKADGERHPRAVDDAGIDVAAEHVGAEPVLQGGRPGALRRRERGRIDGREIRREHAHEHDQRQQNAADRNGGMAHGEPDDAAPRLRVRQEIGQLRRGGDARRQRCGRRVQ